MAAGLADQILVWSLSDTDAYTLETCEWYNPDSLWRLHLSVAELIQNQLYIFETLFSEWFNFAEFPDVEWQLEPSEAGVFLKAAGAPGDGDFSLIGNYDCFAGLCGVIRHRLNQCCLEQTKLAAELFNWTIDCVLFLADTSSQAVIRIGSVEEVAPVLLERILIRLAEDDQLVTPAYQLPPTRIQQRFGSLAPVLKTLSEVVESADWIHNQLAVSIMSWIAQMYKLELDAEMQMEAPMKSKNSSAKPSIVKVMENRPAGADGSDSAAVRYEYDSEQDRWLVTKHSAPSRPKAFPNLTDPLGCLRFRNLTWNTYDDYPGAQIECPNCGHLNILKKYDEEYSSDGLLVYCDQCPCSIAFIAWPTRQDAIAAGDRSTARILDIMESRDRKFQRDCLRSPDQLPDIDDEDFTLLWDTQKVDGDMHTLIKHGDTVIFKEIAFFEGGFRYKEVAKLLKAKYGARLRDLVPTPGGWLYLGGDSLPALWDAQKARTALFGWCVALSGRTTEKNLDTRLGAE